MSCLSPYKSPKTFEGRFLQWLPITYYLEIQETPIELCSPSTDSCIYQFGSEETYPIPIQKDDIVRWVMDANELTIDTGTMVSDLVVAITQQGVLIADQVGSIVQFGTQLFCTATIPCLSDACDYQFVIYDKTQNAPIDCSIFACSTLQDLINSNLTLGDVLDCEPIPQWDC